MSGRTVRVAAVQFEPVIGEVEQNVARAAAMIEDAVRQGARLIALPELADSGYVFASPEEARNLASPVPGGRAVTRWGQLAVEHQVYVVAGVNERAEEGAYNSAVLLRPDGGVELYRKNHLWFEENLCFLKGNQGFPVFDTEFGRVGLLVCYDASFPESFRALAEAGAELVALPTNWPRESRPLFRDLVHGNLACLYNASAYGVFVVAADRIGYERGVRFAGRSMIVQAGGRLLAGPAPEATPEVLVADCELDRLPQFRRRTVHNDTYHDRRTDLY